MYLVLSKKGYYLSLSKDAAEQKCQYLKTPKESIISCSSFGEAERFIRTYGNKYEIDKIKFGELVYWVPMKSIVLIDVPAEESWRCRSDGSVSWCRKGQKAIYYFIGKNNLPDKKTEALLRKVRMLVFFDFELQRVMRIFTDGTIEAYDDSE